MNKVATAQKIIKGFIIGKEVINNNNYACVSTELGKVVIHEDELHDFDDVRDNVGILLGAEINLMVTEYSEDLGCYIGSRKLANETLSNKLGESKIGETVNTNILIIAKNYIIVSVYGNDIKIRAKELKSGWIEDLRETYKVGQSLRAKITSSNPIAVEIIFESKVFDADKYQVGNEYVAKIIGKPQFGIIVQINDDRQVLCYKVDWNDEPKIGDFVVVQISNIIESEEKTYGYIKRRIRKWS